MSDSSDPTVVEIHADRSSYPVVIGPAVLRSEISRGTFGAAIADQRFSAFLGEFGIPVIEIEALEANKTLTTCEATMASMKRFGMRRGDSILAVGGGIVQDIATLSAALYMRGIDWVYAPTTMLSMVDSCVGGKSSINSGGVKNLIGNIYSPSAVLIEPAFSASLRPVDVASGLAEAVKISFCRGADYFDQMVSAVQDWRSIDDFTRVIYESLMAKKWFIEIDEYDKNERQLLNFGHTIGHAIESASRYSISHGIAVALGMRAAIAFVSPHATSAWDELDRICRDLSEEFIVGMISQESRIRRSDFFAAFESDKKHQVGSFVLILPAEGGGVARVPVPDSAASRDAVWSAVEAVLPELTSHE